MKVARIPYLNAEPFYAGWDDDPPFDVIDMVPSELGEAARRGEVDAGLVAVVDYFATEDSYELVTPPMGVAAREWVQSVVLLAHEGPRRLGGKRIGVTGETSTSRKLVELLARARWRIEGFEWVAEEDIEGPPTESVDGLLLIGDRALEVMAKPDREGWHRAIDLATEWWDWQEVPFVFAVWAVRKVSSGRGRERFGGFLTGSLAVGMERLGTIAREHAGPLGEAGALRDYLENLRYRLGTEERAGMERFRELLATHDLLH